MISRAELVDRYFDADIFTIPSVWDESFGVSYSGGIRVAMGGFSSVHPNHRDFDGRRLSKYPGYPEIDEGFDALQIVAFGAKNPGICPIIPALRFRYDRLNHQAAGSATVFGGAQRSFVRKWLRRRPPAWKAGDIERLHEEFKRRSTLFCHWPKPPRCCSGHHAQSRRLAKPQQKALRLGD
jgi:hypothetical protein